MSVIYEIWDYETGNCVGAYRDEASALTDVRDTVRRHGPEATASLVLLIAPDNGDSQRVAAGAELARLAQVAAPPIAR